MLDQCVPATESPSDRRPDGRPNPSRLALRRAADLGADALSRRLTDVLRAADGQAAADLVDDALAVGLSQEAIQSLVIGPAMVRIGELWESGVLTVADEHLATTISERALLRLFEQTRTRWAAPAARARILLAAVEGQRHVLGLRMVADVLESAGFQVMYLGEDVPVAGLRAAVARHRPAIVGLTFGMAGDVAPLADSLWAINQVSPDTRVMLGGRAVPPGLWAAGYPRVVNSMEVLGVVEELLTGPPQSLPPIVDALRTQGEPAPAGGRDTSDAIAEGLARAAVGMADVAREQIRRIGVYRDLAYRDPLTGLANRRGFEERLLGGNVAGALLMLDVDRFKDVNDRHGHVDGDHLLRAVGQLIGGTLRAEDLAARVGGDEFAVVLPGASLARAQEVGECIRLAVERHAPFDVTVSVGVAGIDADHRLSQLSADNALYRAKAAGRNRVVTAAEAATQPEEAWCAVV